MLAVVNGMFSLKSTATCAKYLCYTRYSIVQKLSNKQSAKVIYRFDRLRTAAHSKSGKAI